MNLTLSHNTVLRRLTAALGTVLIASSLLLTGCDSTVNEEGDAPIDASTEINNPPPEDFDAVGTISGRVIDRATSEPIEGATVSVFDTLSATTGEDGSFAIANVPANRGDQSGSETDYNVHITTPEGSPYRSAVTAEVPLVFGNDSGGSGSANNLGANVTFPLNKVATVEGAVVSGAGVPLDSVVVRATQDVAYQLDDNGDVDESVETVVAEATTDAEGAFTLEGIETDVPYDLSVECLKAACQSGEADPVGNSSGTIKPSLAGSRTEVEALGLPSSLAPQLTAELSPAPQTSRGNVQNTGASNFDSATPTWTLTFNRPIAISDTAAVEGLVEENVEIQGDVTAKNLDPISVDANVVNGTTIEWTAEEALSDGLRFGVEYGDLLTVPEDAQFGTGLAAVNGISVAQDEETPASVPFEVGDLVETDDFGNIIDTIPEIYFGIAIDTEGLDAPNVTITQTEEVGPAQDEPADYFDNPTFDLTINNPSDQAKGYIVEYRSGKTVGSRTNEEWVELFDVPRDAADFGEIAVSGQVPNQPFIGGDGAYRVAELRVRAINLNNVEGTNTEPDTLSDNVQPTVIGGTDQVNTDSTEFTFGVSEPLVRAAAENPENYELRDSNGDTIDIDSITHEQSSQSFTGANTITVFVAEDDAPGGGDVELEIIETGNVTDLAGNDFSEAADDANGFGEDEHVTFD
jgi:hypothetical protein